MLLKATSLARSRSESTDQFLGRVTHLHLQNRKIDQISGLDQCNNLKVLYMYDNSIHHIENLDFSKILSYVYLQNNEITSLPEVEMPSLKKLYLDENSVEYIDKFENCPVLEELFVARQKIPRFSAVEFDLASLQSVAKTLQVLDVSGNGIVSLAPLVCLYCLRRIFAQDNNVGNVADIEAIISLPKVEEADFQRNPVCHVHRYRDYCISAASDNLIMLDEKEVLKHQQVAIRGLQNHRRRIGAAFPSALPGAADDGAQHGMEGMEGSLFGAAEGQALDIQFTEADDLAFGVTPAEQAGAGAPV
jgi:protein phosphatase 1 regulatory subunit 42